MTASQGPDVRTQVLHGLFALLLACLLPLQADVEMWREIYGVGVIGLTVLSLTLLADKLRLEGLVASLGGFALVVAPALFSELANQPQETHLQGLVLLGCYAVLGPLLLHFSADGALYRSLLGKVAVAHCAVTIWFLTRVSNAGSVLEAFQLGRNGLDLSEDTTHPNYIGLMAVVVAIAADGLATVWARAVLGMLAMAICVIVSSRSGELGVVAAYGGAFLIRMAMARRGRAGARVWWMVGSALAVAVFLGSFLKGVVLDDVLLLDDEYRGLDTGFTDRTSLWEAAIDLWRGSPILGVGYGQGIDEMGFGTYAHNTMLILLSETGVVGLAAFVLFCALVVRNALGGLRRGEPAGGRHLLVLVLTYLAYGVFEGRAINVGNPLSALFFSLCFAAMAAGRGGAYMAESARPRCGAR